VKMRPAVMAILLPLAGALAQTAAPSFDAASIKSSTAQPGTSSGITTKPGRISARNVTLKRCVRGAFNIPEAQVVGGPPWVEEVRFDIEAKAAGPAGDGELMLMLRALLAERFQLQVHKEIRPLAGYALVVGKGGISAKVSAPDAESRTVSTRGAMDATGCSMRQLAMKLSEAIHAPVADATGVEGPFDFGLKWVPDDLQARTPATDAASGPSIFAALQEQLGLKLEPRKVPTEVLVIDRVQKPTAN
jgi:uncharacterized protein (TIGR03435 family)